MGRRLITAPQHHQHLPRLCIRAMSGELAGILKGFTLLTLSKPSFMSELKRPQDYKKSLWSLGLIEMSFYTIIGATIYYYKGKDVASPALKSISPHMQKVVFGVALPVIFISGSINSQTAAKFLYDLLYLNSPKHKYMNTKQGIITLLGLGVSITGVGEQSGHAGQARRLRSNFPPPLCSPSLGCRRGHSVLFRLPWPCRCSVHRMLHLHSPCLHVLSRPARRQGQVPSRLAQVSRDGRQRGHPPLWRFCPRRWLRLVHGCLLPLAAPH